MRLRRAVGRRDRRGEEILQLEHAARRRHVLVGRDAADRRFVHGDGIGHRAQVERLQVLDAVREEAILLAHDLLGHAQDGARALVEALHQPVGVLQAVEQIALVLVGARRLGHGGVVAAVDEHARQGVVVEFHHPAAVWPGRTITSGSTGWICTEPNFRPGLGLSRLISAIISTSSSASTPTARFSAARLWLPSSAQVLQQLGDLRIVAVAVLELQGQAFGEIARKHAGRIEALQRCRAPFPRAPAARRAWRPPRRGCPAGSRPRPPCG